MAHPRGYHSAAILLPDGSVIVGGDPNGGSTPNERYLPSYFFKPRPAITGAPASVAHGAALTIQTATPAAISEVVLLRAGAVTHAFNHNQRSIGCAITGTTATAVNATAPPDGTIAPPGHYLLFVLDHDRVPSPGAWMTASPNQVRHHRGTMAQDGETSCIADAGPVTAAVALLPRAAPL